MHLLLWAKQACLTREMPGQFCDHGSLCKATVSPGDATAVLQLTWRLFSPSPMEPLSALPFRSGLAEDSYFL